MAAKTSILILGAGVGGLVLAHALRKRLPTAVRITVVEQASQHVFAPSLLWLMTGDRTLPAISRPLVQSYRAGVEFIQGRVERINAAAKQVVVDGKELTADYLVVALGAETAAELVPGLAESGHNLYHEIGAAGIRDARLGITSGRVVIVVSSMPFKCPAAPYEAAMLLEADFRRRGLNDQVQIHLFSPEPGPMPVTGQQVSDQVRGMVESKGIRYYPQHKVARVDPATRVVHFENGTESPFDLLIYVPPHRAPEVVRKSDLAGETGWITVDRGSLETKFPGVYALGDVTVLMLPSGKPLPKAGVFAHAQAEVLVDTLVAKVAGHAATRLFDGRGKCFLEIGDGRAGLGAGDFFAMPKPEVELKAPSRWLHWGKVLFEKYWLFKWF